MYNRQIDDLVSKHYTEEREREEEKLKTVAITVERPSMYVQRINYY